MGERLHLHLARDDVRQRREEAGEVRLRLLDRLEPHPLEPLDEHAQRPVGDAHHLVDDRRRPDLVEVLGAFGFLLGRSVR